jgi:hypothetical protein
MTAQELRDEMVRWGLPHTSLGKESTKETNLERLKKYLSDDANKTFLDLMHKIKTPADLTPEQISRGKLEHLTKAEDSLMPFTSWTVLVGPCSFLQNWSAKKMEHLSFPATWLLWNRRLCPLAFMSLEAAI